ncbi:MAG: sulfatase-like hydrolase/transferase [candidate division KSB1 bacterium]|nr:sulfatase-like hydrolase/transferase [candidate division KSB1 bacterium]
MIIILHLRISFQEQGYHTAVAGKWQLPGQLPTLVYDTGFDKYCIWMNEIPDSIEYSGGLEKPGKPSRFHYPGILQNGKQLQTEPDDYGPDMYTDFIIDFMKNGGDQPFLVYYPMCLTHLPWDPTPDQPDIQNAPAPERLAANVEYMDKMIGRLIQALDESGLRDNTIILFTGDNGTKYNGKYTPTELGARVPMIVNAPRLLQNGVVSDELLDLSDVMPTIADFTGASLPTDRVIDGHSFAHIVKGEPGPVRDWCFSFLSDKRVLRDKRWLLEYNSPDEFGYFYYCGDSRNGEDYKEVTHSNDPKVITARKRFINILRNLPAPQMTGTEADEYRQKMMQKMKALPERLRRFCAWIDFDLPYDDY